MEKLKNYLTPHEQKHQVVLGCVAREMSDTPYILKGGTALLLTRGLNRHSTDLDFDSPKKLNIQGKIRAAFSKIGLPAEIGEPVKDTETVQRFKVKYFLPHEVDAKLLKIETSFREIPDLSAVVKINGIRTYNIATLFGQKVKAFQGRDAPRDLFDLMYIAREYPQDLFEKDMKICKDELQDLNAVLNRYEFSFSMDMTLNSRFDCESTIILRARKTRSLQGRDVRLRGNLRSLTSQYS